ncbi:MAG TPA: hypothetical protein VHA75_12605 [Rugosimonospora sp.]|nr:hypothetical protein [Rugosimonospora sp.]
MTDDIYTDIRWLPPKVQWGGYLYAIEFTDGMVKVGTTSEPIKRIGSHARMGSRFGVGVGRVWISPPHADNFKTEAELVFVASRLASGVRHREYFTGCQFDLLVGQARQISFPPIDAEASQARARDLIEVAKSVWRQANEESEASASDDPLASMNRVIGRLFGRSPDGGYAGLGDADVATAIPFEQVLAMSDALDMTTESLLRMSLLDLHTRTVEAVVQAQAAMLRVHLIETGQTAWLEPMPVSGLPADAFDTDDEDDSDERKAS